MSLTMKDMLDAGVHFGHQTERWNPKMKPYVYTARGGIHIIDLQKTLEMAKKAFDFVESQAAQGKKMVFVGTKKQAIEPIQSAATTSNQFYVTKRWLGGTLTNFVTIKQSIDRMRRIEVMKEKGEIQLFSKKERSSIEKEYVKLNDYLTGIKEMKETPSVIFVVDLNKEHIAIKEAKCLGIKVVGLCDTNSDPGEVDFPIPANDDAIRSIKLFSGLVAEAYNKGSQRWKEKLRTETDKQSDVAEEMAAGAETKRGDRRPRDTERTEKPAKTGPAVVKMNKGRKLVAAGTADEIEIQHEVEMELAKDPVETSEEN